MPVKGGKYCVAGFANAKSCKNSSRSTGISMHLFPRDAKQRAAWTKFVRKHRPGWNPTSSSALCSAHFHGHDYNQRLDIEVPTASDRSPNSISCKRYLKPGTVPTVDNYDIAAVSFPKTTQTTAAINSDTPQIPACKVKRAKRQLLRELSQSSAKQPKIQDEESADQVDEMEMDSSIEQSATVHLSRNNQHKPVEPGESEALLKCKKKLKTIQQRCSNYRRTIRCLRLQVQAKSSSSHTPMVDTLHQENQVEDVVNEFDGNLEVDQNELDDFLAEADDMSQLTTDPDWETEYQSGAHDEEDTDGEDTVR